MRLLILGTLLGAALALTGALFVGSRAASAQADLGQCSCSKRCAKEGSAAACTRQCQCGDLACVTVVAEQGVAVSCK